VGLTLAEAPERYVTRRELARVMGISPRSVDALVADGMPSETWGMKRTRRFLPSQCVAWARARSSRLSADRDRIQTAPGDNRVRRE
jgi:phage terminase Nu1 subunit (DNA packaging protein)